MSNELRKVDNSTKVINLLEKMKPQMALALPKHINADKLARIALTEFRRNPKLQACDATSFVAAVMLCGQLGVEIGPLGQAYLIPYKQECTFMLSYKGMIELARRSGQILSLTARVVHEKDKFEYTFGLEDKLIHEPTMNEAGPLIAAYAVAKLKDGGNQFDVMSKIEIDKIRASSPGKDSAPWRLHYPEMAKKTVIRRLFKFLPVSVEMQRALALEDRTQKHNVIDMFKEISNENGIDIDDNDFQSIERIDAATNLETLVADKTIDQNEIDDFVKDLGEV